MNPFHKEYFEYFAPKSVRLFFSKSVFLLLTTIVAGNVAAQSTVQVDVSRFRNNNGVCQVCIFDNAEAFKGNTGKPLACQKIGVQNRKASLLFTGLKAGTYAIMLFHDANGNGRMDTNFLGIPSEGYGASMNNLPFAAAPTFNGNKFTLAPNHYLKLTVRLRNL